MIKKKDDPKPAEKPAEPPRHTDPWNPGWNIHRRLLEARRLLRNTPLWKTFQANKDYEAFSIHQLARGVEDVLGDLGVTSHMRVTKWSKQGFVTVVEGIIVFTNVDNPTDTFEVPTVGEGIDDSDKGISKADSHARKVGMVNALNLGIGSDNEEPPKKDQPQPATPQASMSGAPQQATSAKAEDFIHPQTMGGAPASNGAKAPPMNTKTYVIVTDGKGKAVLGSGMVSTCWAVIQNAPTVAALDAWGAENTDALNEFLADDPANGDKLNKIFNARRLTLSEREEKAA